MLVDAERFQAESHLRSRAAPEWPYLAVGDYIEIGTDGVLRQITTLNTTAGQEYVEFTPSDAKFMFKFGGGLLDWKQTCPPRAALTSALGRQPGPDAGTSGSNIGSSLDVQDYMAGKLTWLPPALFPPGHPPPPTLLSGPSPPRTAARAHRPHCRRRLCRTAPGPHSPVSRLRLRSDAATIGMPPSPSSAKPAAATPAASPRPHSTRPARRRPSRYPAPCPTATGTPSPSTRPSLLPTAARCAAPSRSALASWLAT